MNSEPTTTQATDAQEDRDEHDYEETLEADFTVEPCAWTDELRCQNDGDDLVVLFAGELRDEYAEAAHRDDGTVFVYIFDRGDADRIRPYTRYIVIFHGCDHAARAETFNGAVAACAKTLGVNVCIRTRDRLGVALDDDTTCSTVGVGYTARDRLVEEHGEEVLGREVLVVDVPTDEDAKPWVRTETVASALFLE